MTRLQNTIRQIKENRGKERQYMMWQDIIDDAKEDSRQVMIKLLRDMLSPLGTLPDDVIQQIDQEKDLDQISAWIKLAAKAESLKDFYNRVSRCRKVAADRIPVPTMVIWRSHSQNHM